MASRKWQLYKVVSWGFGVKYKYGDLIIQVADRALSIPLNDRHL